MLEDDNALVTDRYTFKLCVGVCRGRCGCVGGFDLFIQILSFS